MLSLFALTASNCFSQEQALVIKEQKILLTELKIQQEVRPIIKKLKNIKGVTVAEEEDKIVIISDYDLLFYQN
ncbi:hypothetical protein ACFL4O_02835 [bacterium]